MPENVKKAVVFLSGHYCRGDKKLAQGIIKEDRIETLIIAVDGGLKFLQSLNIKPDHWITDMDSAPRIKKGFLSHTETHLYSNRKDATDGELALDFCRRFGVGSIIFMGWYDTNFETDHLLGNLFLPYLISRSKKAPEICYLSYPQEIYYLRDRSRTWRGRKGWRLSAVPLGRSSKISLTGTAFGAKDLSMKPGATISLRNEISSNRCRVTVDGQVLVILGRNGVRENKLV